MSICLFVSLVSSCPCFAHNTPVPLLFNFFIFFIYLFYKGRAQDRGLHSRRAKASRLRFKHQVTMCAYAYKIAILFVCLSMVCMYI